MDLLEINIINMTSATTMKMIDALDNVNYENKQITENGHFAYGWSKDTRICVKSVQESIVQLYFQCVLEKDPSQTSVKDLQTKYIQLFDKVNNLQDDENWETYIGYLIRLALQTRDIISGKGMCNMAYHMFEVIAYHVYEKDTISREFYMNMFKRILNENEGNHPLGSWKDLKHFLHHLMGSENLEFQDKHTMIQDHIVHLYVDQMVDDRKAMSVGESISLCGKWLPRESSKKHKWLARSVARSYYNHVFCELPEKSSIYSQHYREICSKFNKYLDTTQIQMCRRTWENIDFDKVTALTLHKFKDAFLNKKNINEEHRNICRDNLLNYVAEKTERGESLKAKVMFPHQLVSSILHTSAALDDTSRDIVNLQWKGLLESVNQKGTGFLEKCIPCIDVSPSMYHMNPLPLHAAIGMGLMAMECSMIHRAFTFSETPEWIVFDDMKIPFHEKVQKIAKSEWGGTTDIYSMFQMMLKVCVSNKVSNEDVGSYSLFIFSDMQFNACYHGDENSLMENIHKMYAVEGYTNIPYIIFWNLRSTNNFPTISKTPGCTKLSGNSASLFKFFMNTSIDEIKTMTNWTLIKSILDNKRYSIKS